MDGTNHGLNVTYITFVGHVELDKYRFLYFMVTFVVYILILCTNSTILCLIWIHKNLHQPMYIFIGALLLNSVLYSTTIYPKLLIDFLSDRQVVSYSMCILQCFVYYSLNGSEFFLLSVMAYDRYVSICKPLRYASIMRKTTVSILLVLAWLLPACQLVPSVVLGNSLEICSFTLNGIFCNNAMSKIYCMKSQASYIVYGAFIVLTTVLLPLLFILFTYTKILIAAYRSCRDIRKKAAQTCLPHLLVLISFSCLCSYDVIIARLEINLSNTARFIMTLQLVIYHPLFNPIIYGLKMQEISKHLRRLFIRANSTSDVGCTVISSVKF
ncbi:olfactory receptor 6N2-like [Parambassis ranga]|uniref:Olfactory receptor n=1 Tax=Parambassis ranga TaxID=210632 RepID=A0A6P7H5C3_9TELE|nr:olfactory receptor 6N2-like [Parambassis ranga]